MMNTSPLVQVERVEEVVASQWFTDVRAPGTNWKSHYTLGGAHDDQISIWNLYITRILPSRSFLRDDEKALFVQGAGQQMRYDLFDGQSSLDEIHLVDAGVIVDGEYTADWMFDFVKENWPCDEAASQVTPANGLSVRTVQCLVGSLAAASVVLLLALYSWSKKRRREATYVQTSLEEVNFVNTELT